MTISMVLKKSLLTIEIGFYPKKNNRSRTCLYRQNQCLDVVEGPPAGDGDASLHALKITKMKAG
jgi:hypothetical protein